MAEGKKKKKLKTKTHFILKGMKLRFKNGEWVSYKLGALDLVKKDFEAFKRSVLKQYGPKLFEEVEPESNVVWDYDEIEKCSEIGTGPGRPLKKCIENG